MPGIQDLSFPTRDQTSVSPAFREHGVLTTQLPEKFLLTDFLIYVFFTFQ